MSGGTVACPECGQPLDVALTAQPGPPWRVSAITVDASLTEQALAHLAEHAGTLL